LGTKKPAFRGAGEIAAVQYMNSAFSQADERFGGGHARPAVVPTDHRRG
jgi:hypothetical protein